MDEKKTLEVLSSILLNEAQQNRIKSLGKEVHLNAVSTKDSMELPREQWEKIEVLLASGQFLPSREQAPALKWIQLSYAGVERAMEHKIVYEPSVITTSSSGVMVSQMGEYALMALLALGHRLPDVIQAQKEKKWLPNSSKSMLPRELRDSTVGIVGYGSVGREVARLLYAFGATVLAAKKDVMQPEDSGYNAQGLGDPKGNYFHRLYPIEGLKGMLRSCDFVVLTLPLTPETRHILSTAEFEAMKTGAGLVNVGRGGLVDETALEAALKTGKLGGAVLDVFEQEPLPESNPLWSLPNVIITPHVSGLSAKLMDAVVELFVENLKRYLDGEPLYNVVNVKKGY
ncbi:MAG: D-2-hydroxyacid dehydrogenase [Anaerolineaceae bacterium]